MKTKLQIKPEKYFRSFNRICSCGSANWASFEVVNTGSGSIALFYFCTWNEWIMNMKKKGVSPSQFYGLWVKRYSAVKTSILRDLNRTESQEMVMSTIASLKHMDLKKTTLTKIRLEKVMIRTLKQNQRQFLRMTTTTGIVPRTFSRHKSKPTNESQTRWTNLTNEMVWKLQELSVTLS